MKKYLLLLFIGTFSFSQNNFALIFDGQGDYVDCGNDPSLNLTNNFTIEVWFKLEQWGSDYSDSFNYIISKITGSWDSGFQLMTNGFGDVYPQKSIILGLNGNDNTYSYWYTNANKIFLDTWIHVAVTYSSGEVALFLNGQEQVINLYAYYDPITTNELSDHSSIPLYFGDRFDFSRPFVGLIDEVRFWDEIRSETEITENLFTNLSGSEDNLVGYWKFDEGSGEIAEDGSLNTNDGDIIGATYNVDILPEIISRFTTSSNVQNGFSDIIHFMDNSIAKEGINITSWEWNFGDGNSSTQQNPNHSYLELGVYTVSLTITADNESSATFTETELITVYNVPTITSPTQGQEFQAYSGQINFSWTSNFNFTVRDWKLDWYKSDSLVDSYNINMSSQEEADAFPYFSYDVYPEAWTCGDCSTGDDYKFRLNAFVDDDTVWVESDYFTIINPMPIAAELIYPTSVDTFSTHVDNNIPILFTWRPSEDANDDDILYKLIIQLDYFGNTYTDVYENISDTTISIMSNALDPLMNAINPYESNLNWYIESYDGTYTVFSDTNQFFLSQSVLSINENQLYPKTFALHQNYPNPFNPHTKLKYDLPKDSYVSLTIYDMLGNVVNKLVNKNQNSGYKSIQWNATNNSGQPVSAGVYLYTIEAGDFRQTKKMILLK